MTDLAAPLTVTLSPEASALVRMLAEDDGFPDAASFIEAAARAWMERHGYTDEELARLYEGGLASGEPIDAEQVFAGLLEKHRVK
jgi:Arc/MetJ-type ribon-helix-helix transcriptional regulator